VKAFYDKIPGSKHIGGGVYTIPCFEAIPPISFTIGGKDLPMSSSTLTVGPVKPGSSTCVGSITIDENIARTSWILGESWMRNYYTIFDYDNSQVGFADLK
jgi:cathepsin D